MSVIWKFTVPIPRPNGRSYIDLPDGADIISTGIQGDDLVVWATIPDQTAATHCHRLIVANTGSDFDLPFYARFVGTVTHIEIGIVWHVFDGGAA